ncbi:type IV pilus assembly protein PilB [Keratinibaculum paraultunense]|uniref:Type IV pilus assembly protein PilB n=1 Tax=Keratinibaculum paraultunense TaxID=1278232 RepID=A0A4R3L0A5_9FIRM|nr:GspE/PulE family protein [Keratinibaculum paraultunense]QQY80585.1 Flp pilus assembly complex ATPase component TadA [Keratinibaculum paraultunense]TCS91315.1 type IV pilus assembly protein PilB [Keratinibaculum paraultunense]
MKTSNLKLGELLLYSGKITKEQLNDALEKQKEDGRKLGEILVEEGYITNNDIIEVLEFQLGIPHVDLDKYTINPDIVSTIPENIARRHELIAIDKKGDYLIVAMADPLNIFAIDDIKMFTKLEIQPVIASKEIILKNIDKFYIKESTEKMLKEFKNSYEFDNRDKIEEDELLEIASAPIVKLINSIIQQAVDMRASDIHIEPYAKNIRIRFRVDGDLHEIIQLSSFSLSALVTRIKIMGKMNIAEKRVPQDGRAEAKINGKEIDIRISTIPTVYGEKIVLRLLERSNFMFSKDKLGFNERNLKVFDKILRQPYGIILVTGPTGSGKTTTLYATLKELNKIEKNIVTIEDPVEYKLEGINQVQVNPKAGLTFASGLRSILRQDPDIIMVGEIRDSETAEIAVRAAITGHLVLSTLHTNDCASSIIRLIDMGIEPYLVSSAVIGVVSQRLVKELCSDCKVPYKASYSEKSLLGLDTDKEITLYKPNGCNKCNNGYKGRRAVHEVMIVNENIRRLIDTGGHLDELKVAAREQGMISLLEDAVNLALNGYTTVEEVLKAGYTLG